jgi:hypothetical protein
MRLHTLSILNYGKDASYGGVDRRRKSQTDERDSMATLAKDSACKGSLDKRIENLEVSPQKKITRQGSIMQESRIGIGQPGDDNILFDLELEGGMYNMWKIAALQSTVKDKIEIVKNVIKEL